VLSEILVAAMTAVSEPAEARPCDPEKCAGWIEPDMQCTQHGALASKGSDRDAAADEFCTFVVNATPLD
jgi:hypothetical protein